MKHNTLIGLTAMALLFANTSCTSHLPKRQAPDLATYSRGIGQYPGDPAQNYAPVPVPGGDQYRNLALYRTAQASSSHDYNLTAQLVTDGRVATDAPVLIRVYQDGQEVDRRRREVLFDGNHTTGLKTSADVVEAEVELINEQLQADALDVMLTAWKRNGSADITVQALYGEEWRTVGHTCQSYRPHPQFGHSTHHLALDIKEPCTRFRVRVQVPDAGQLSLADLAFSYKGESAHLLPSEYFCSLWRSQTCGAEWLSVDLGASANFDRIVTHWLNAPASGRIQTSADGQQWSDLCDLTSDADLSVSGNARYLRLMLDASANGEPYELSELEVWGRGGIAYQAPAAPQRDAEGMTLLSGGEWRLQRADAVTLSGEELTSADAADPTTGWLLATVPATVLGSHLNLSAIPDPNYADQQLQLSESYFMSDFWYRRAFDYHPAEGRHTHLQFDGINWKAEVFLNGTRLGLIEGAFQRGDFDVTPLLREGRNLLAVRVIRNAHFGIVKEQNAQDVDVNGGILGADNATFHASIGWDWIPTIRGREVGIWNDVRLQEVGAVRILDPFVSSTLPLPDTTSAELTVELTLVNQEAHPVQGLVTGSIGEHAFQLPVTLAASEVRPLRLTSADCPQLHIDQPRLWWPNGYGEPYLYDVNLQFEVEGTVSHRHQFHTGIRQMTWEEVAYEHPEGYHPGGFEQGGSQEARRLELYVNGRRFIGFGGNWGFAESNLNYRAREYDAAVAYHRDMHFTMIRNWVGQIPDDEFFEACDRYGIMIWQDFWLANPWDGPDPYYNDLFKANALDFVRRIRNHPALGLYVGRNEGYPPREIDDYLRKLVATTHPGMHYIPHSAADVVSGGGPYNLLPTRDYFTTFGCDRMHSERGIPCVMNYENLERAFGTEHLLPVNTVQNPNAMYGMHDYAMECAMRGATFNERFEKNFGPMTSLTSDGTARRFAQLAQWMNYDGYRAAFEGRSTYRQGLLLWMSHPAWPSMVWQTYDYYLEPTAAYFACKKACEPLHILYNPATNQVVAVNYYDVDRQGVEATCRIYSMEGALLSEQHCTLDLPTDHTADCFALELPDTAGEVYYLKLTLTQGDQLLSENFYCQSREVDNLTPLWQLPATTLQQQLTLDYCPGEDDRSHEYRGTLTLRNTGNTPALMLRVKVLGAQSRDLILPVFYSDNYFSLLPGEEKQVTLRFKDFDTRGEAPIVEVEGFNLK